MNIQQMLDELRAERQQVEEAILALERMATGRGRRRGRRPKWMVEASLATTAAAPRKRRRLSREARAKIAEAQRKRWAAKRKAKG